MLQFLTQLAESDALGGYGPLLEKITFRSSLATLAAFLVTMILGPRVIRLLGTHFRERLESRSPRLDELQRHKQATPTMGGLFVVAAIATGVVMFGDLSNRFVLAALGLLLGLAALGGCDDLKKIRHGRGLRAATKLLTQLAIAAAVVVPVYTNHQINPQALQLDLPLLERSLPLGIWFIPLATLVVVASSNAVNLTDGLDGLASGCLLLAFLAIGVLVYAVGHAEFAAYFGFTPIRGAGELTILVGTAVGALLGFLWFNCQPAQVFLGDTGSLPLGGLLGFLAIVARQELLLALIAGVFVAEAVSVIAQVVSYRLWGRRVLRCAPLHHHFQFRGWAESKIVARFWIAAVLCAVAGLSAARLGTSPTPAADSHLVASQPATESTSK